MLRLGFAGEGKGDDAGDEEDSADGISDDSIEDASSDTDDEAEKQETLQMKVMRIAKGLTIQDLLTPRGKEKEKAKAKKGAGGDAGGAVKSRKPDPDGITSSVSPARCARCQPGWALAL